MRISELSSQAGVPIATIKFYLREHLLPEGIRTAATQAQYDESHVARLRLIRALLGPAGLSVAAAHQVIQAIEKPPESLHELLGVAAAAVAGPVDSTKGQPRVHELMQQWGWQIDEKDYQTHAALEDALRALEEAGVELAEGVLDFYRDHMLPDRAIRDRQCADRFTDRSCAVCGAWHGPARTDHSRPSSTG